MKKIIEVLRNDAQHWVGDGFPVRSLLSYSRSAQKISPFLLLDHAGPTDFPPADEPRGVGDHPHRGFETVTIVYQGEVAHKDSVGHEGKIGPGDVQWMTAASGIIHQEMHSQDFTKKGGPLEMVQLWVNLPAKHKMSPPKYQTLLKKDIPVVDLGDKSGTLRVISGTYAGQAGPANTFSPVNVWDVRLNPNKPVEFKVEESYTTAVVVLSGPVSLNSSDQIEEGSVALLDPKGTSFTLEAKGEAKILILNGKPIQEPIFGHGPFVMNTKEQIEEAIDDFNRGKFIRD